MAQSTEVLTPATTTHGSSWTTRSVTQLIVLILVGEFSFMTYAFPTGVVPLIAQDFKTTQAIWVVSGFAIGSAACAPLLGRFGDRYGKKRILTVMLAAGIIGALLVTFAPNFGVVILGRVLQGLTLGLPFMNASLVRDIFPASVRSVATALVVTGSGLLSVLTSLATKPVIAHFGWRGVIWVPALYAVVVILLLLVIVPESSVRARGGRFDVVGSILLAGAVACLLIPISLGSQWGWTSASTLLLFAAAVVLGGAWVGQALRTASPVIALREFRYPPLALAFALAFFGLATMTAIYTVWGYVIATPKSAGLGYGLSLQIDDISTFSAIFAAGSFIGGFATGWLLRRVWAGPVAVGVFSVCALGYAIAAFSLSSATGFGVGVFVLSLASGGGYAVFYNLVAQTVRAERQASTAAAVTVGMNIGGAILPVVLIAVLNRSATIVQGAPLYPVGWLRFAFLVPVALSVVLIGIGAVLTMYQRAHEGRLHEVGAD